MRQPSGCATAATWRLVVAQHGHSRAGVRAPGGPGQDGDATQDEDSQMQHKADEPCDSVEDALSWGRHARGLFDASRDPIFVITPDGRIREVNAASATASGAPIERLIGCDFTRCFTEPERARTLVAQAVGGAVVNDVPLQICHVSGRSTTARCSATALRNVAGVVDAVLVVARDLTEHERATAALQASEERYRLLFQRNVAGVFRSTVDGRLLDCNQAFAEMLGFSSSQELLSHPTLAVYYHPASRERFLEVLRSSGAVRGYEALLRRRDGTSLWALENASLVPDDTGELAVIEGTLIDITQRKPDEEKHRRLLAAIDQAAEGIVITSPDGLIEYVNPAFEAKCGRSRAETVGRDLGSFAAEAHLDELCAEILKTTQDGETWQGRIKWRRSSGSTLDVDASASPVRDSSGAIVNLVMSLYDATERVALEAQLVQAHKMEAIGRLAAGVAHDFNNVLQAMDGLTHLIGSQRDDPERVTMLVRDLEREVLRGASLTRQLLLSSRHAVAQLQRLDLNEVVGTAVPMLRRIVRRNVIVTAELASKALPVEVDRGQIDRVLTNLAVNASDAMPEGGRLVIRTGADNHTEMWLEVGDTGHGIPEEIRERIFEPFFTTKESGRGTGLGLSVVHDVVRQHRGRVEVRSVVNQGTTFRVILPPAAVAERSVVERPSLEVTELPPGRGEHVLVVEDEDTTRRALREILINLGYQVAAVGSGEEAGTLPAQPPFALLLTDLMLPGIAGSDLARDLKARWSELRVILMSGYADDEALRRRIAGGEERFLQKPFDMATLAREVRAALDQS